MTKHFAEEGGSCFIGEKIYTLKELAEMDRPQPPKPPPMRELKGPYGVLVNEYKTVDWYTEMGKLVDPNTLSTRLPITWFGGLFMNNDQKMLERSLTRNRMMCTEWPR